MTGSIPSCQTGAEQFVQLLKVGSQCGDFVPSLKGLTRMGVAVLLSNPVKIKSVDVNTVDYNETVFVPVPSNQQPLES